MGHKLSSLGKIIGVSSFVNSRVASSELLIAMKLHSGRDSDLKDAVMLIDNLFWQKLVIYIFRGSKEKVSKQLSSAVKRMQAKDFGPQLKSFFGLRKGESRRVSETISVVERLSKLVENQ
ncbi:MAG: hypothetical protein ACYCPW_09380 [Nitrososphaerales archaeon]